MIEKKIKDDLIRNIGGWGGGHVKQRVNLELRDLGSRPMWNPKMIMTGVNSCP